MDRQKVTLEYSPMNLMLLFGRLSTVVVFVLAGLAGDATAQVFKIEPSVLVSQEYNDNLLLQGQGNERTYSYITRFAPSVRARYNTSFWDWDIHYTYSYYYYLYKKHDESHDQTHALNASNRTELLKDNLYLEMHDEYSRVSQNIVIDFTRQSPSTNQVDQNVFTMNPYALLRIFEGTRLQAGYVFRETRYLNASSEAENANVNRDDMIGYAEFGVDLSSRLTFTVGLRNTEERNNQQSFNLLEVYAGPQYAYAETGTAYVRAGRNWFHFRTNPDVIQQAPNHEYWFWDGGISHRLSTITLTLGARRFVAQDPQRAVTLQDQYTATIMKTSPRSVLTIGGGKYDYRDAVLDQRISSSKQLQGSILYRLTPTTNVTLRADFQDVEDLVLDGVTEIALGSIRLEQHLSLKDSVSIEYHYANSHSYDIAINNYSNNRCLVEYRHMF